MANGEGVSGPILAADGRPLRQSLARALRLQKLRALALIAPLLIFILVTFAAPIADMLFRSVENSIVPDTLPLTVAALEDWDDASGKPPGEEVFAALRQDLLVAVAAKAHTKLGSRLNYEQTGVASLLRKTGRHVKRMKEDGDLAAQFAKVHKNWAVPETWAVIKRFSGELHLRLLPQRRRCATRHDRRRSKGPTTNGSTYSCSNAHCCSASPSRSPAS